MNGDKAARTDILNLAQDPLIRLVMASDGVSEAEFVGLMMEMRDVAAVTASAQSARCRRLPQHRR